MTPGGSHIYILSCNASYKKLFTNLETTTHLDTHHKQQERGHYPKLNAPPRGLSGPQLPSHGPGL